MNKYYVIVTRGYKQPMFLGTGRFTRDINQARIYTSKFTAQVQCLLFNHREFRTKVVQVMRATQITK